MVYIPNPTVRRKLTRAERDFCPVFVSAAAGWGKTTAINYYYRKKATLTIDSVAGRLNPVPPPDTIRQSVVIVDDVTAVTDDEARRYVLELLAADGLQIVLVGEGPFPVWLDRAEASMEMVCITEKDLAFDEERTAEFFRAAEVELSAEDRRRVITETAGYPPALRCCLRLAQRDRALDDSFFADVRSEMLRYLDAAFFQRWEEPFRELLLAVCPYPVFNAEMAAALTGRRDVVEWLEYAVTIGTFLKRQDLTYWTVRQEIRELLLWKRSLLWPKERDAENYREAARYYEEHGDFSAALVHYEKAGATRRIVDLLVENALRHPGTGQYYELRHYYGSLPEDYVLESPVLMAGMSMLYSLMLRPEESERWYEELKKYEQDTVHPKEKRREAKARLAYLDIGLPHRAGRGMISIMRNIYTLHRNEDLALPEFSVTGNTPSLMNGGLDFCDWGKNGTQIARFMGTPVEALLGKSGKGMVNICLAECGFEMAKIDPYEVVTRCNNGAAAADNGGVIDISFAAEGVLIRQHIAEGQLPTAMRRAENFRTKATVSGKHLLPNLAALEAWLALYAGDVETVGRWLKEAPNEQTDFCITDRYRYMVKIRCLIAEDRLVEAMDLASYLTHYFETYRRTFLWIENEVLKAIILYRWGKEEWRATFKGAMERAEGYHLLRIFTMEGGALLPLVMVMTEEDADSDFLKEMIADCRRMALWYPDYLKYAEKTTVSLTEREQQILALLCGGKTTEEICDICNITYSGLKKHNHNIYGKLGVKNRAEAERVAARLGLVRRRGDDT